ncbi:MAG: GntR family transcriptional regulator [Streptosporangiales bacterium]|nr:GntR family transcriptional regulator [Streptosporangiales bacterium]
MTIPPSGAVTTMYASIRDQLASEITSDVYPAGALLPSIREIMQRWEVSTTTARRVLDELVAAGYARKESTRGHISTGAPSAEARLVAGVSTAPGARPRRRPYPAVSPCDPFRRSQSAGASSRTPTSRLPPSTYGLSVRPPARRLRFGSPTPRGRSSSVAGSSPHPTARPSSSASATCPFHSPTGPRLPSLNPSPNRGPPRSPLTSADASA